MKKTLKRFAKLGIGSAAAMLIATALIAPQAAHADYDFANFTSCGGVVGYSTSKIGTSGSGTRAAYFSTRWPGNRSNCVGEVQRNLNRGFCAPGTSLVVDGIYGARTKAALAEYQRFWRNANVRINGSAISVDGVLGPQTWHLFNLRNSDTPNYHRC